MPGLNDFLKALDDIKVALIAITSTISIAAVCAKIVWDKFTRKK
jgi:hypothetical protein